MNSETLKTMQSLKLNGMAQAYEATISLPINMQPDTQELIALLLDAEYQHRSQRRSEMYLKLSKMRYKALLADIRCSKERNLSKQSLNQFADSSYIQRAENIIITGATGCGKSYLACALGHQACTIGYRTMYYNLNRLTEQIAIAKADGSLIKWLNKINKVKLLILDDFGLQQISHQVKLILLQILEDRYAKGSIIICSQLPVSKWHEFLNEPTIADAILDRIIPKAHRIELKGKSLRTNIKSPS